jgi:hypothetical protein
VKDLGLADLTPLRTFRRPELVEFQAALRSCGGIQTATERVMDRLITRRRKADPSRRTCARSDRTGTARRRPIGTPAWLVVLLLVSLGTLGMIVLVSVP